MEYQHASSATTFSKKLANGGSLSGKHVYDGVFDSAKKPGSRMEDYGEIFGGSVNCSIPILDFPELEESKASVDARNSRQDYSKIFGGFGDADFAVPYEELFAKPKKAKNSAQESEARAAAEARFCRAGQKHSNFSQEKQAPSPQVSFQSLDGVKQFNVSYDKSNPGSKNGTSGMTHVAQLNAVPGYTFLINGTTPPQMTEGDKPVRPVLNDAHLNANIGEGIKQSKTLRKVVSGPQPRVAAKDNSRSRTDFHTKSSRNRSFSNDISFDTFDIGLGPQPSPMSPLSSLHKFGNNKDGSMRSMNSKFGVFGSDASEGAIRSYSPPFWDEQIDANSAAAASAAAVRKAIEEAQAKLRIAKQLMDRKKEGIQKRERSSVNGLKSGTREIKQVEKTNRSKEEAQQMPQKVYDPKQVVTSLSEQNEMKASLVTPDFRNVEKSSPVKNAVGETHNRDSKCTEVDRGLEAESEKATKGFSEPAGTTKRQAMELEVNQANDVEKMKPSANGNKCKENITGEKNIMKPMECERKEAFEAPKQEKVEMGLNSLKATFEWDMRTNNIKSAEELQHQEENEEKTRVAYKDEEADRTPKAPNVQKESESMQKRLHEPEENANFEIQGLEEITPMKEAKEVHDWAEIENKQREAHYQEEMENQLNEVPVGEANERKLDEIHRHEGNGNGEKEDLEMVKCEKKQHEDWGLEENEKKHNVVSTPENFEDSGQEESQERLSEECRTKDKKNLEEAKQNKKVGNEDYQMNESEKKRICEWVETGRTPTDINGNNMKATQQAVRYQENNIEATNDVFKLDENENASQADEDHGDKDKFEGVEVTAEVLAVEENGRTMAVTEDSFPKETEKESKAVKEASNVAEEENFESGVQEQGFTGFDAIKKHIADSGETDLNHKKNKFHEIEYERICEREKYIEEHTSQLDENYEDVSEIEIGPNDEENESNCVYSREERWLDNGIESKSQCDPEKHVEEAVYELGENNKDVKESEVAINHEEDETYFESSSDEKWVNNRNDEPATPQPHFLDCEGKSMGLSQEERTNQRTDEEENNQETITVEKREAGDTLQKEVQLEKKHHQRKEEAKLREMEKEKEKERIAVERAIREARERAFAEARERAERAAAERVTAEAHQRVMAETQERSFPEANSKSAGEKASIEAKLKAERAAVERATAEARVRALEKALSEKAAFKVKNQTDKFAAEKFSGASRDAGIKSSDQQYKGPGPSSSSRYPSSSNDDDPYSTERVSGVNGESTERCKATLERNQRTAERAAKALAEKNMRDLLAQKEQAERNRLAETLDADVKRWSSGKERNLRALLSTLHYILGPDSGWQPIPLTDLISTAAVKKAYRKATLFVHPDKLQQRGATTPQKYTCEKVFDLLKDAWNKFSAEER